MDHTALRFMIVELKGMPMRVCWSIQDYGVHSCSVFLSGIEELS